MTWRISSYSAANGSCVQVGQPDPSTVLVRNSNHTDRGTLALPVDAMATFVTACKAGELDDLTA